MTVLIAASECLTNLRQQILVLTALICLCISNIPVLAQNLHIDALYCEYRINPQGIDVTAPRLSWKVNSLMRGDRQSAFRVIVAASMAALNSNKGDIWDSQKHISSESNLIYGGPKLKSGKIYYWKVMAWDSKSHSSGWSKLNSWSMGLLNKTDWKAQWITHPVLADPANFSFTPVNCYRSQTTSNQNELKWVMLDLGTEKLVDEINLMPARSLKQNMDFLSCMYPLRYKIQVSGNKNFNNAQTVADETAADVINPRDAGNIIVFKPVKTRYIRVLVTKLAKWDVNLYGLALGGIKPSYQKKAVAGAFSVESSDSIESAQWSKKFLLQAENQITNAPDAAVLGIKTAELTDIPAVNKVSRVPTLRREFLINRKVTRATLYATARGFYEFHINGKEISHNFLVPGVTDFNKKITYQAYDVMHMLRNGANAMGAMLGYGWYAGHMNLFENRNIYGHYPMLMAQLELEFSDGTSQTIVTDQQWKTTLNGAVLWSDLLDGEAVDQREEIKGWDKISFNDQSWLSVKTEPLDQTKLVWQRTQPIQEILEMKPVAVKKVGKGVYVFDFGQEIAGWCRLRVAGKPGMHIRIKHAELLKNNAEVDMSNLWGTAQQEDYILNGDNIQTLTPHFTYHGFRYAEVSGLETTPDSSTITAISMHNSIPETGKFVSSNPLYNKLMETAIWTQRNLLFDMPAGCAARSERLGWTGDIRPCVQSLIYTMDATAFLEKYAEDMRDEQTPDGRFTDIAPQFHLENTNICVGSPGWADAGVSMPYQLYLNTNDKRILEDQYPAARRWVEFILSKNPGFIWEQNRGMDWGDWISAGVGAPKVIGSTAFFANDADILSKMARILGRNEDEKRYRLLFENIKNAFKNRFVSPEGKINEVAGGIDVQGSYAMAIHFKLLDEPLRSKAVSRLAQLVNENQGHLTTGFWSSIEMLLALSDNNQHKTAVRVANTETSPSWGYMLKAGGTTFWESFDADKRNLSLNHWTYSSIAEWLWQNVAGLRMDPEHPGYKHFFIEPKPEAVNDSCASSYNSVKGLIKIKWKLSADQFAIKITVPAGSSATLKLPVGTSNSAGANHLIASGHLYESGNLLQSGASPQSGSAIKNITGLKIVSRDPSGTVLELQSGTFNIVAKR